MGVKEKRKALKNYCDGRRCDNCIIEDNFHTDYCNFEDAPDEVIETWHATVFPEKPTSCTATLDYKEEYHKLLDENAKLQEEIKYMQMGARELRENNDILRAKLDMVYLIFGGHNR